MSPQSAHGMQRLFRQFSFPGGIPSHAAPETPGSIHEGGELGYALSHAYGAAFDNPDLIVACVVGDGEAETGPLATSWHSNKFLNPVHDGAVLPILHLNGYKIANPTVLARIPEDELRSLFVGYGYKPHFVEGDDPATMHQIDGAHARPGVRRDRRDPGARRGAGKARAAALADDRPQDAQGLDRPEGGRRPEDRRLLALASGAALRDRRKAGARRPARDWMRSYRPEELFDDDGALRPEIAALAPEGARRMGANPHANGGLLMRDLDLPDIAHYDRGDGAGRGRGQRDGGDGGLPARRDGGERRARNFRVFGPDETPSNRLGHVFEVTERAWNAERLPYDEHLAPDGRVMEMLSEHTCQGWLEGYLLTGRHGLFSCYEAFIHIVDSMFNQHAKWLKSCREIPWRRPIASLNYLLTSHVWRQDHNGFSHQDPGFIDHVGNKKADIVRVYLPPDANTLLWVTDHCLRSWNRINVIVAGKQPAPQWLTWRRRSSIARRASASGNGPATTAAASPTW